MCAKVLVFLVIAIVFVNIESRPTKIIKRDLTDNRIDSSGSDKLMFKLPTTLKEGVEINIKGNLNPNHETFHALLPSATGKDACQIVYHFKKQTLKVMPPTSSDYETAIYKLDTNPKEKNTFILKLKARSAREQPIFDFIFEGNEHLNNGPSHILPCKLKSFKDISYIVMKEGVHKVTSLLFEFN